MWKVVMRGPWLSTLPLSVAVHAAGVVLVFVLGSGHLGSSVLVVDLSEPLVAETEPPLRARRPAPPPPRVTRVAPPPVTAAPRPAPASPPGVAVVEPEASDRQDAGLPRVDPPPVDREVLRSASPPSLPPPPPSPPSMEPAARTAMAPAPSPAAESPARQAPAPAPPRPEPARGDDERGRRRPEPRAPGRVPGAVAKPEGAGSAFPVSSAAFAPTAAIEAATGTSSSGPGGGEAGPPRAPAPSIQSGSGVAGPGTPGTEPEGAAAARALPGSGGGDGAEYSRYLASLRQRILDGLRYPAAARRRSMTGTVQVEIVIEPNGAVGSVTIVESSSYRLLDEAAVDAVRRLPPLPFPRGVPPRTIRARLPIVFDLR